MCALPPAQTFEEADLAKDGRISHEEWLILVQKHPVIINYMTLPVLREVGLARLLGMLNPHAMAGPFASC